MLSKFLVINFSDKHPFFHRKCLVTKDLFFTSESSGDKLMPNLFNNIGPNFKYKFPFGWHDNIINDIKI